MSDIFSKYFKSTFTLKSLLLQLSLKLKTRDDTERLERILSSLSTIIVTFDFELKGSIKSYIDTRNTLEELLYLLYCKINQTQAECYKFHMFKSKVPLTYDQNFMKWDTETLRNKLLSTENPSICYFLSEDPHDGHHWHGLHELIGAAIIKYVLLYGCLFRRINNTENMYVQVSGFYFSQVYPSMVEQLLMIDNKKRYENIQGRTALDVKMEVVVENQGNDDFKTLKDAFETEFNKQVAEKYDNRETDVKPQLQRLGNKKLLRGKMMYDRNFGIKIPIVYVYSSPSIHLDSLALKLVSERILSKINLTKYQDQVHLEQMKDVLTILMKKFINSFRSCPVRIFVDCYCKNVKAKEVKNKKKKVTEKVSRKRKREEGIQEVQVVSEESTAFNDFVDPKNVYCFVRRCLMHVLEYSDKDDNQCAPLIGGQDNFKTICKFLKSLLNSLRFDTYTLNNLLNGIKTARIAYLLPLNCDRYKRLVLMAVLLWLIEEYVFVLIRSCFYVTETCATNAKVFFYLKEKWKKLLEQNFNKQQYKQNYNLEKVTSASVVDLCSRRETSGVHMGRLLPKNIDSTGRDFRIISGSKALNLCTKRTFGINYQFISLYQCLKYLVQQEPTLTGFACPSHSDIQRRYSTFLNSTTYNRPANIYDPIKKWNFMKIDVEKCFDNVDIDKILFYLTNKFSHHLENEQNLFTIFKYSIISFDLDKKHLKKSFNYLTQIHRIEQKGFCKGIQDFILNIESNIQHYRHLHNCIFIPIGVHERNITSTKLEKSLTLCFNNVFIKIHDQLYTRLTGIMHGSICSRIICDLYLGKLEIDLFSIGKKLNDSFDEENGKKKIKMQLNTVNEIVLRVVDDYLIICDSTDRLQRIKTLLDTKLKLNHGKTIEIFWSKPDRVLQVTMPTQVKSETIVISDSESSDSDIEILSDNFEHNINFLANNSERYVLWNGLNFDVHTLDVYLNYEKYFNTDLSNRICRNMIKKNSFYEFNLKYLRLFNNLFNMNLLVNLRVNRIQAIVRNIVDVFTLSAIRFQLLYELNAIPDEIMSNLSLQIKVIQNLCYLGNHKIKSNLRDLLYDCFTTSFLLLKFICFNVFVKVFKSSYEKTKRCKLTKLCNILEKLLIKLNFIKCIRLYDSNFILFQLNTLIDQQLEKFKKCEI